MCGYGVGIQFQEMFQVFESALEVSGLDISAASVGVSEGQVRQEFDSLRVVLDRREQPACALFGKGAVVEGLGRGTVEKQGQVELGDRLFKPVLFQKHHAAVVTFVRVAKSQAGREAKSQDDNDNQKPPLESGGGVSRDAVMGDACLLWNAEAALVALRVH